MTSNQVVRPSERYLRTIGGDTDFMWLNAEGVMFKVKPDDHFIVDSVLPSGDLSLRHMNSKIDNIRVAKWTVESINS